MGFEIPVDVDYFEHPKTVMLVGLISREADIYPLRLWRWCALYARKGVIPGGASQIEAALKWRGKPGRLHAALVECGFIEKDGKTIHDWREYTGRAIKIYEDKKKKQRDKYAEEKELSAGILPEEKSRIPPTLDVQDTQDAKPFQDGQEITLPELAQRAAFLAGRGTSPKAIADWHTHLADLVAHGISVAAIALEINKPKGPDGRKHSEPPWEFQRRMLGEGDAQTRRKSPHQERGGANRHGDFDPTKQYPSASISNSTGSSGAQEGGVAG